MSNIFPLLFHIIQVGSFGNTKYAPHIKKFYRISAAYVFWSSVRFLLDSLYTNGKTVNVNAEMNTGSFSTAF